MCVWNMATNKHLLENCTLWRTTRNVLTSNMLQPRHYIPTRTANPLPSLFCQWAASISIPKLRSLSTDTCLTDGTSLTPQCAPPYAPPSSTKPTNTSTHTRRRHVCRQHSQCVQCHQCPAYLATKFLEIVLNMCLVVTNANTQLNMPSDAGVFHSLRTCPRNEICE